MLNSLKSFGIAFLVTFLISLLIFGILALIFVPMLLNSPFIGQQKDVGEEDNSNSTVQANATVTQTSGFSALIIGTDYQKSVNDGEPSKSQTMIFITIDETDKNFVYMSIPTCMDVVVDDSIMQLSDVYKAKGIDYLCEKVSGLIGIGIKYYAIASIDSMKNIVDELGGVTFDVPVNMKESNDEKNYSINITKGKKKLDGETAVNMLRYMGDSYSDRMTRNRDFMQTIIRTFTAEKYKDKATDMYRSVANHLTTNFNESDLMSYIDLIWSYSDFNEVILTYPGTISELDGVVSFVPDTSKAFSILEEYKN